MTDYHHTLDAIALCIAARIPMILWGNPGDGKTSMVESIARTGWHVETVIVSQSDPLTWPACPSPRRVATWY